MSLPDDRYKPIPVHRTCKKCGHYGHHRLRYPAIYGGETFMIVVECSVCGFDSVEPSADAPTLHG